MSLSRLFRKVLSTDGNMVKKNTIWHLILPVPNLGDPHDQPLSLFNQLGQDILNEKYQNQKDAFLANPTMVMSAQPWFQAGRAGHILGVSLTPGGELADLPMVVEVIFRGRSEEGVEASLNSPLHRPSLRTQRNDGPSQPLANLLQCSPNSIK